ncbi:hypothetical protein DRQ36_08745 [bacterium]|nr:MAG: hypothetical protein DRQ36_08745 [bacterium]
MLEENLTADTNGQPRGTVEKTEPSDTIPMVSVIIPVRNEEQYLERCLESIAKQTYRHDRIEILVVNGCSKDSTSQIASGFIEKTDIPIRILDNPDGNTPCGLNIGYKNAKGDIFIHFIGHAVMSPDFIEKDVACLLETGADAVGGLIISSSLEDKIVPRAIGYALNSVFGLGGVTARTGTKPRYIDNPSFAAYRRELFEKYGYIDERLTRNQDYEFNHRISKAGARIYFTPEIKSYYFNRQTYKSLWNEYFNAAKWRTFMIGRFSKAIRKRHLVPPLFVLSIVVLGILSVFSTLGLYGFLGVLGLYSAVALISALGIGIKEGLIYFPAVFLSYFVIHIAYGLGFIWGLVHFVVFRRGKRIVRAEAQ